MKSIFSPERWRYAISQMSKRALFFLPLLFFAFSFSSLAQNNLSVSFSEGFIGTNTGTQTAGSAYHFAAKGWTNVQFAQNSGTTQFYASQGNDIPGNVIITDYLNVERSIPGYIKWRGPSGNVSTVVFSPTSSATLATGPSTTETISSTSYIGLTFNGLNWSFTDGDNLSGNSAGTLTELNSYLSSQPKFSVTDLSVNEGAGTATVTVSLSSAASTSTSVAYVLSDGTAAGSSSVATGDYRIISGNLTFNTGVTSRTFTIDINEDVLTELNETVNITLQDPVGAAILDPTGVLTIVDNDSPNMYIGGTLNTFTACLGAVSAEQSFTVEGSALTNDIVLTAPSGYEISTTSGSGFATTLTLTRSGSSVATTTIYIRLANNASNGNGGNVTAVSSGATQQNIATGTAVVSAYPTVVSTTGGSRFGTGTVTLTGTASTGATLDWYAASTGGSVLTNGTGTLSFVTPSISSTTNYYAEARNTTTSCLSVARTVAMATINTNTPPTITTVANQNVVGTASTGDLAVTVGDAETSVGSLTLTATSSNQTLVPNVNIILGGSGANRTVSVSAASGQTGTATITLTVTDGGGLTTTSTFTITVNVDNSDSDGDGVSDAQERIDGTSPTSGCDFKKENQNLSAVSTFWKGGDCDNDGISNFIETYEATSLGDFDQDGIPNMFDPDSDQDGINDSYEKNIDTDLDGDADFLDLDSDNDGILDSREMVGDMDRDGVPNYKDLDSDGDGIFDVDEATENFRGGVDLNRDGRVDNGNTDRNTNGWPDSVDSFAGSRALLIPDTDRDGAPDFLDLDADGDGILDSMEGAGDPDRDNIANFRDLDSDGDWLGDGIEGRNDADGDGMPNYLDLDSDGDSIIDSWEGANRCASCTNLQDDRGDGWDDRKQFNPLGIDTDGDGTPDFLDLDSDNDCILDRQELGADGDGDEKPNFRDTDSDGDGIPDNVEAVVCNAPVDTDSDGKPDFEDLDSDNDGISDAVEKGADGNSPVDSDNDGTPDYRDLDSDNDGIPDAIEGVKDTDGDGKPDYIDVDSDNDGIPDSVEKGKDGNNPVDTDGDGTPDYRDLDSDNDGIPDAIEAGKDPKNPVDTDGDGTPDFRDLDSDNDGIPDAIEAGKDPKNPVDTDGDGTPDYRDLDSDNDGIPDAIEAGKDAINPTDTDGDGIFDFRDLESDGDSISDKIEAGADPKKPVDTDADGLFDFRDLDSDNDTIPDSVELTGDTDGDAKPDYLDTDSDNDGLSDKIEAGANPKVPVDSDKDGKPDFRDLDSDGDGMLDREETGSNPAIPLDTDKDGIYDFRDTDADNDGILDVNEDDLSLGNILDCDKDGIPNRLDADTCPSVAPQGISPNRDGKNDVLAIPGLLATPGPNKLTIFNRWGNIVYESADYKNNWGGETDRAFELLATDGLLPDGTYYYILDYQDRKPTLKAYIYINRLEK